jgi:hypothetical protein
VFGMLIVAGVVGAGDPDVAGVADVHAGQLPVVAQVGQCHGSRLAAVPPLDVPREIWVRES